MNHTIKQLEEYLYNMEAWVWFALEKDPNWSNALLEVMADIRITREVINKFKEDRLRLNSK